MSEADWYGGIAARGWSEMPEVLPFITGLRAIERRVRDLLRGGARRAGHRHRRVVHARRRGAARRRQHGARRPPQRRATRAARHSSTYRGITGMQSGDDGGRAGQRLATQRRAEWFPRRLHTHEMATLKRALVFLVLTSMVSAPAAAQSTRVEAIAEEQAEKAKALGVEGPSKAEQVIRRVLLSPLLSRRRRRRIPGSAASSAARAWPSASAISSACETPR